MARAQAQPFNVALGIVGSLQELYSAFPAVCFANCCFRRVLRVRKRRIELGAPGSVRKLYRWKHSGEKKCLAVRHAESVARAHQESTMTDLKDKAREEIAEAEAFARGDQRR